MATERVFLEGALGERLAARVDLPVHGAPRAWVLFAHCFTCSKNLRAVVRFSQALNLEGFGVLRFDFTGLGESEGDFEDTNFSSNVQDLVAVSRYMEQEWAAPEILVGHSLGGAAVIHAAHEIPSAKAVATIGAPGEPAHVLRHIEHSRDEIESRGVATVRIAGRPFTIRKQFLDDLDGARMSDRVESLRRALLILHSPVDQIVGIDNAARLYEAARHPKSFVTLDDADHLLSDEADARYAARVLAAWASRYVPMDAQASEEPPIEGERVVVRTGASGFRTDVWADGHRLVADEPRSAGGTEEGPTPYDLLVAGLGSCTTMTLRMYADRKKWPLAEVRVALRHTRRHGEDDGAATDDDGPDSDPRLDRVEREIHLVGDLDDEQRSRLLEIAERCPVHRTLERGVEVTSRLAERDTDSD